jgi:hypothetical protein
MTIRRCLLALSTLLSVLVALPAQTDASPAPKAAKLRVHVIGASVSGGFRDGPATGSEEQGDSVALQRILKKWVGEHAVASTHNPMQMMMMFMDPEGNGAEMLQGVEKAKADIVVAVDFPFWFAYGFMRGDEAKARTALQNKGFDLLSQIEVPLIIGDLPDMRGAAVRMLKPSQVPSPEVLKQLNEQLAAWAAEHPNVRVLPLAKLVRQLKDEGVDLPLQGGALRTPPGALMQPDRLHANRLGMALLGYYLQEPLRLAFPEGHPLREQKWTFEQFVEAAGAEPDLETVREAAKKAAEEKVPVEAGSGAGGKGC